MNMNLKNNFKEEDKIRVWVDHQFCAICKSNQNCSLHHVDSRRSDSIFNSIMLCHKHHVEADCHNVSDEEYKERLTRYAMRYIVSQTEYVLKNRDYDYLSTIQERLNKISLSNNK